MLGQVRNFSTYLAATTLWIDAMFVFRAVLAQMSLLFAHKAACKLCTPILNGLGALGKRMSRFTTVIAKFLQISIAFLRAILQTMAPLPAKQANLILLPEGLLGASLGDVVGGLADEAAFPGAHPWNPQRVLRPPHAAFLGLLEHALLFLVLLFAIGRRDRLWRKEIWVRLSEALPRLPLSLVRHL